MIVPFWCYKGQFNSSSPFLQSGIPSHLWWPSRQKPLSHLNAQSETIKNQIFTHYVGKSWYRPIYMQIPTQHCLNSYKYMYHSIIWNHTSSKQFKRNNSWKCWLQMIIKKNKMLITCIIQEFLQRLDFRMKSSNFFLLHVNW